MSKTSATIIALLSLTVMGMALLLNNYEHRDIGRVVYNACEKSRLDNTVRESDCAALQDKYKYEYLCQDKHSSNATDSWTQCWVESNDQLGEK